MRNPFRRTDNANQNVPAELEPYYEGRSRRQLWLRRGLAALILIAILVLLGWAVYSVYQRVTDDGTDEQPGQQTEQQDEQPAPTTPSEEESAAPEGAGEGTTESEQGTSSTNTDEENQTPGTGSESEQSATITDGQSSTGKETAEPAEDMPATGPADVAASVIGVSILAGIFHRMFLSRRV